MKKQIIFNPESRDFSLYLDDVLVGTAKNHTEADTKLNRAAAARQRDEMFWANRADMEHLRVEYPEGYARLIAKGVGR